MCTYVAEVKPRPSVNIKDILQVQVGFNCLLSHEGVMLLMLPMTCKDLAYINSLLLMYSNTLSLDVYAVCNMLYTHGIVKMATMYVCREVDEVSKERLRKREHDRFSRYREKLMKQDMQGL